MKDRISIQVGLSGYSFKIQSDNELRSSGWMSADRIFTCPELQRRYEDVELSVFTPKVALIPSHFHHPLHSRTMLEDVVHLSESDPVESVPVPEYAAVLIYSNAIGETLSKVISDTVLRTDGSKVKPLPELYFMLKQIPDLSDYNKILASYMDGVLYLAVAQGKSLLLCNSFQAPDFTTAQYFIFLTLKKLQLNPEVSTICFRTPLTEDQEMSLYRYFKSVEQI
ncbi:MAG: DUF3822 family protein [Bacteroidales bacterium]|nr:DUF3822 family protein [Bacteroidales bacterium]